MKLPIAVLAGVVMLLAGATLEPGVDPDAGIAGLDPAFGCITDSDCRSSLRLVGWPRKSHRAQATIEGISAGNGGRRLAGDRRLLTTISPNDDGVRDRAEIRFRLTRTATVKLLITRTATRARVVDVQTRHLAAGPHTLYWAPPSTLPARTYLTYLAVRDRAGWTIYGSRNGDPRLHQHTPVIRVLEVDAAFRGESYVRGDRARLRVFADAERLTLQVFRCGPERTVTKRNDELNGVAVTEPRELDWRPGRRGPHTLGLRVGDWPTGVYFAKLTTLDGRVGFAPFIVRPERLGQHRIAVVMPTNTWQAYNLHDADGDGWGETWYVHQTQRTVQLGRPHLARGVPMAFRTYDLPFLHWLAWNEREVDYLAQGDVGRSSGPALRRAYDLIVFPGHHEYVTRGEYDAVAGFRNLGGNLMFLSANNFFWRVDRQGTRLRRIAQWRRLGRPEAALIGVEYVANGRGRAPYTVRDVTSTPWLFAGTGFSRGSSFGHYGIEVDRLAASSPPETHVLAEIRDLFGRGRSAHMTYYETKSGAKVFAAGAFTLAGSATSSHGAKLLDNLWRQMTRGYSRERRVRGA
jgi:hypothetical protein